ncbi:hypothetical protein EYF80_035039 [Liparis tanakae]|uniref:Uncharacterized protein n=1 Tax=Liparis tanakae TaxID=230148 RepID=A0A4Z2GML1_9TELE|nr:hypothetical protein EYF80_035039 [Liparis tanakae]
MDSQFTLCPYNLSHSRADRSIPQTTRSFNSFFPAKISDEQRERHIPRHIKFESQQLASQRV